MNVKVCDMAENFEEDFIDSIINTGFVVLTNHVIDHSLIKEAQREWHNFFTSDITRKSIYIDPNRDDLGYKPMRTETAVGAVKPDLKEFYHWKPDYLLPMETLFSTMKLYEQLEYLGLKVLSILADREGTTWDADCEKSKNTLLRTIYYPAMDFGSDPGAVRSAAHEDINYITLLVAASAPGLQVLDKAGQWHDVPHEENSIVMNVGDMLQLASQGLYQSTTHRVVNPADSTSDRISMPLFIHPAGDTILAPGKTAQQYLNERLAQIYGVKK